MSRKKYANAQEVLERLIKEWNLEGYPELAKHVDVPYQTLMAWKKRGKIGNYLPFINKCISLSWLETGEGPIFNQHPASRGLTCPPLSSDGATPDYYSQSIKKGLHGAALSLELTDTEYDLIRHFRRMDPHHQENLLETASCFAGLRGQSGSNEPPGSDLQESTCNMKKSVGGG